MSDDPALFDSDLTERQIMVLAVLDKVVASENERVRENGKPGFKAGRRHKTREVYLPGTEGEAAPVAKISIMGGTPGVTMDPAKLLEYVRRFDKPSVRRRIPQSALLHPEVRAWIEENHPDLVEEYVDPDVATKLTKIAERNSGRLTHPGETGEFTQAGTPTISKVDGRVSCTLQPDAIGRVMAALANGTLSDLGLWPLAIAHAPAAVPPAPEPDTPVVKAKPDTVQWMGTEVEMTPLFDEQGQPIPDGPARQEPGAEAA